MKWTFQQRAQDGRVLPVVRARKMRDEPVPESIPADPTRGHPRRERRTPYRTSVRGGGPTRQRTLARARRPAQTRGPFPAARLLSVKQQEARIGVFRSVEGNRSEADLREFLLKLFEIVRFELGHEHGGTPVFDGFLEQSRQDAFALGARVVVLARESCARTSPWLGSASSNRCTRGS